MSSRRRASTPTKSAKSAKTCAPARQVHLDDSASGIVAAKILKMSSPAGPAWPVTSIKEEETQKLLRVEEELHKRIISQEKAISALARAIRRSRAGLKSPNRPIGSFLFSAPPDVGKTEVARTLGQLSLRFG